MEIENVSIESPCRETASKFRCNLVSPLSRAPVDLANAPHVTSSLRFISSHHRRDRSTASSSSSSSIVFVVGGGITVENTLPIMIIVAPRCHYTHGTSTLAREITCSLFAKSTFRHRRVELRSQLLRSCGMMVCVEFFQAHVIFVTEGGSLPYSAVSTVPCTETFLITVIRHK